MPFIYFEISIVVWGRLFWIEWNEEEFFMTAFGEGYD